MAISEQTIYDLVATMADMQTTLARMSQPMSVTGKAGALVALAKDSRLDGRIGAGDVVVSVMLAAGGASIGAISAAGIQFGNVGFMSTGEAFGLCTMSGCAMGLGRMALDALAVPLMLSNVLEWLEERHERWLEEKYGVDEPVPVEVTERPLIINGRQKAKPTFDFYDVDHANYTIVIKEETDRSDAIKWTYSKLWFFIEDCFKTGEWARRPVCARWKTQFGPDAMSQGEHAAIYAFINKQCPATVGAPGLWGLVGEKNRPTLEAYLKRFRWTPSQATKQPSNQAEANGVTE